MNLILDFPLKYIIVIKNSMWKVNKELLLNKQHFKTTTFIHIQNVNNELLLNKQRYKTSPQIKPESFKIRSFFLYRS